MIIPNNIDLALNILYKNNFEGYLVGGCVRDYLMGKTPNDYDITTNATPDEIIKCFKGYTVIPTGIKHGTISVVINHENIEITTYRIDGEYEDNRHPKNVVFTRFLEDDLKRRDFTINAIAYSKIKGFVDLFDGKKDIENKIISCVGDSDKRFLEDGLRILRALRFSSVLNFSIDEKTKISIHKNKHLLKNISAERIYVEFTKLLCGNSSYKILLEFSDVICEFIPEVKPMIDFKQNNKYHIYDVYTHSVFVVKNSPAEKNLRLSAFFHDIGKPKAYAQAENNNNFHNHPIISEQITKEVLRRLKVDNDTINNVSLLVLEHDTKIIPTAKSVKYFLKKYSFHFAKQILQLKRADIYAQNPNLYEENIKNIEELEKIINDLENCNACVSLKSLEINGKDLLEIGITDGKSIGTILNNLLNMVIEEKIENKKEPLLLEAQKQNNRTSTIF